MQDVGLKANLSCMPNSDIHAPPGLGRGEGVSADIEQEMPVTHQLQPSFGTPTYSSSKLGLDPQRFL
jgi:hypothetical protein